MEKIFSVERHKIENETDLEFLSKKLIDSKFFKRIKKIIDEEGFRDILKHLKLQKREPMEFLFQPGTYFIRDYNYIFR